MWDWSSWQGYGCLTYVCTGVYILCSSSGSIPSGCWYMGTEWQSTFKAVLFKTFLEGCRSAQIFRSPDSNSSEYYWIIHSDHTTKLNKAWDVTFLILHAFPPLKVTPSKTHFSFWHLLKKGTCAKLYVILWQKVEKKFVEAVSSISIHQIWIPSTTDSQLKDSFPLSWCSCIRIEKKLFFSRS